MFENPFTLSPEAALQREHDIDELMRNPQIIALLKKMNKEGDRAFVAANSSRFKAFLQAVRQCRGCKGLEFCTQNLSGRVKELYLDREYLSDRFVPCKFARKKQKELAHKDNYKICHLTEEDLLLDFDSIDYRNESHEYADALMQVLASQSSKKGIYLYGKPGTGKSYIAKCLTNRAAKEGTKVSFVNVSTLIKDLKDHMRDDDYQQRTFNILKNSPVLVLDDLGSEQVSAWSRDSILFPLLDYRMNNGQKTYFTSNYSLHDLEDLYSIKKGPAELVALDRLFDRIRALSNPVILPGDSRRC